MTGQPSGATKPSKRKFPLRFLGLVAITLLVLASIAPLIIARTGLRDWLIHQIIGMPHLSASVQRASLGWFSPLEIGGAAFHGRLKRFSLEIERVEPDRSWPKLWAGSPELGTFLIDRPHLYLDLPLGTSDHQSSDLSPTFTATVSEGALTIRLDKLDRTIIELDGIELTAHMKATQEGRILTVEPFQIFPRQTITPDLCSRLLHYMSPALKHATLVEGEFSLGVRELKIPLGVTGDQLIDGLALRGELGLHQVTVESDSPILQSVCKMVADLHNRLPPKKTRVIKDETVVFGARNGRIYHEGLHLGFPDIDPQLQIDSRGSVGLDETLDLLLSVPRLDPVKQRQKGPVECRVTGTIRQPRLTAPDASLVIHLPDQPEPLVAIDGIALDATVLQTSAGSVIAFEPLEVLKREKMSPKLASGLLKWIDPEIRYSPQVSGEVSLSFETLRLPLGGSEGHRLDALAFKGKLGVYDARSLANTPLRKAIVRLLADLYGKRAADVLRITQDSEIDFEVRERRLYFGGLSIGFPDINPSMRVGAQGSIGFDGTLDVRIEVPSPEQAALRTKGPMEIHVTGTVEQPQLFAKDASLVIHLPGRPEPLIDVDGIPLTIRIEKTPTGPVATFDPVVLFTRKRLTRRFAAGLLPLLDQELQSTPAVTGEVSLSVDRARIPLDLTDRWLPQVELQGTLDVRAASNITQTPLRRALIQLLTELFGKPATKVNHLVYDSEIYFKIEDGRLHYSDLRIGFPDIDPTVHVRSEGSIGLDESLDLSVEVPVRLRDSSGRSDEIVATSVWFKITGSLRKPKVEPDELKGVRPL
jgi:hypothetical protein